MPLIIEDFERDIIIDEVILNNKDAYTLKDLQLSCVKDIVSFYLSEYLPSNENKIDFDTALGSALNIGKLLLNFASRGNEGISAINSKVMDAKRKLDYINKKYAEIDVDLSDEIYAKSVFSVVPNFVMSNMSYIKLELLRHCKSELFELKINIHKLSRVLEKRLYEYLPNIMPPTGFKQINEAELYSIGLLYLKAIIYIYRTGMIGTFNHKQYTLSAFMSKVGLHINDIYYFINSYEAVSKLISLSLIHQIEIASHYIWLPPELSELQAVGQKVYKLANAKNEGKAPAYSKEAYADLKSKISDNTSRLRLALYNKYKKYYNDGIDLGLEYAFEIADEVAALIEQDLAYICGENEAMSAKSRSRLFLGDDSLINDIFADINIIKSILENAEKGE